MGQRRQGGSTPPPVASVVTADNRPVEYTPGGAKAAWYGSASYVRMWFAQVVSSTGDWVGIIAVTALSNRIGGPSATGLTLAARFLPAFFLAPVCGLIVDRFDRKKVMVSCDVLRAALTFLLLFQTTVWGLVLVSFFLEFVNLLWGPAKDASVPNLVQKSKLEAVATANLGAAYGTFPIAAAIAAGLFPLGQRLDDTAMFSFLRGRAEGLPILFDVATFIVSAALIATVRLRTPDSADREPVSFGKAFSEIAEGIRFIRTVAVVRAVMIGMGTALVGGGLVIPLGRRFASQALAAGDAGYSLLLFAIGTGAAVGVLGVSVLAKFVPRHLLFSCAIAMAGASLMLAASMNSLGPAVWCVAGVGLSAGAGFVLANTILQSEVDDALRGRVFASFYAIIRLALTVPLLVGPFLTALLDGVSRRIAGPDQRATLGGVHIHIPGVRVTMWIGATVVMIAAIKTASILGISVSERLKAAAVRHREPA